jgi:hypothetical protein
MFKVIDRPQLLPGCDFVTGTDIGPFLDLDLNSDDIRNGWIYVARSTVEEMAKSFGMLPEDEAVTLKADLAEKVERVAGLEAEVEALRTAVDGLTSAGYKTPKTVKK